MGRVVWVGGKWVLQTTASVLPWVGLSLYLDRRYLSSSVDDALAEMSRMGERFGSADAAASRDTRESAPLATEMLQILERRNRYADASETDSYNDLGSDAPPSSELTRDAAAILSRNAGTYYPKARKKVGVSVGRDISPGGSAFGRLPDTHGVAW